MTKEKVRRMLMGSWRGGPENRPPGEVRCGVARHILVESPQLLIRMTFPDVSSIMTFDVVRPPWIKPPS